MKIEHFAPSITQWMLANQNEETPLSEQVERSTLKQTCSGSFEFHRETLVKFKYISRNF